MSAFIANFQCPNSLDNLRWCLHEEGGHTNLDYLFVERCGEPVGEWTVPTWARLGDRIFFMCGVSSKGKMGKLARQAKKTGEADLVAFAERERALYDRYAAHIVAYGRVACNPYHEPNAKKGSLKWATIRDVVILDDPVPYEEYKDFVNLSRVGSITKLTGEGELELQRLVCARNANAFFDVFEPLGIEAQDSFESIVCFAGRLARDPGWLGDSLVSEAEGRRTTLSRRYLRSSVVDKFDETFFHSGLMDVDYETKLDKIWDKKMPLEYMDVSRMDAESVLVVLTKCVCDYYVSELSLYGYVACGLLDRCLFRLREIESGETGAPAGEATKSKVVSSDCTKGSSPEMERVLELHDTLQILDQGSYGIDGTEVKLHHSKSELACAQVVLADAAMKLYRDYEVSDAPISWRKTATHRCVNVDALSFVREQAHHSDTKFLILNVVSATHPGGNVRSGSNDPESSLCRASSLLLSLESRQAAPYYAFVASENHGNVGDALLISPNVEIIRDGDGSLLKEPVTCAVLTCALPRISDTGEPKYLRPYRKRIDVLLSCVAALGYRDLVLGPWGMNAGISAEVVSEYFYHALKNLDTYGFTAHRAFDSVTFAVGDEAAYPVFESYFTSENFYREEIEAIQLETEAKIEATEMFLDQIRGCMVGGAVGDALGYPVEFMTETTLFNHYGPSGITSYEVDAKRGVALISDDTQMTLFTATGLLFQETRAHLHGIAGSPRMFVQMAYQDWLMTQDEGYYSPEAKRHRDDFHVSWLVDVPELYSTRAPGNTCLSALESQKRARRHTEDYIEEPQNTSKGCGGIMRVAPMGLWYKGDDMELLDREAAQLAAITHGHSLGYMPAAVLAHIINRLVYGGRESDDLKAIVCDARDTVAEIFKGDTHLDELVDIINLAIELSENDWDDLSNINRLGEGWVAEETLAIALYCSLRHRDDFAAGVIAAVNHKGDSDSTGAVTGNILGARLGFHAIDDRFKEGLELMGVILEIAGDLCHGCWLSEYSPYEDLAWESKYLYSRRFVEEVIGSDTVPARRHVCELVAVRGDITDDHGVDVIVNAANESLLGGGGVDGAIHRAAGPGLLEECKTLHGCETGLAKATDAYRLPCKKVIHTVGPRWRGGGKDEAMLLESCYHESLTLAEALGMRSVAFPSISTGVFGYPLDEAADIAVRTVREYVEELAPEAFDRVVWVLFDDRTFEAYERRLKEV